MQEWTLHRTKLQCQREEANEEISYAIAIVKGQLNVKTENQGIWPRANWQHVYFFNKVEISNVQ